MLISEESSKVKMVHFKFILRKSFAEEKKVRVNLEAISG